MTLMLDTVLRWTNVSMGLSQVALIGCAAGSCVMVTTAASGYKPAVTLRIAIAQYRIAAVIAAVSLVMFFAAGQQPEMAPQEYLKRNLGSSDGRLPWLLPLLYVLLALTLTMPDFCADMATSWSSSSDVKHPSGRSHPWPAALLA